MSDPIKLGGYPINCESRDFNIVSHDLALACQNVICSFATYCDSHTGYDIATQVMTFVLYNSYHLHALMAFECMPG
jgi:hypothetical protein